MVRNTIRSLNHKRGGDEDGYCQFIFKFITPFIADIEAGKWRVGDRIPSERDLAVTFKVSRMTLRQAIQTLVDEGILERRVGSGTCGQSKVQEKMSGVTSFTDPDAGSKARCLQLKRSRIMSPNRQVPKWRS